MFPSSRNVSKLSDFTGDKGAGENVTAEETEGSRRGIFADRGNRKSTNDREGRDMRDSWTTVRDRRQAAGDDGGGGRYNRRDRDHDNERRTGESRWGSRDERRQGDRTSWRDREREKKDRDWGRGEAHQEKEPEWMDDPAPLGSEDDLRTMGIPQNQEEFQRWKELQKSKLDPAEERFEEPPPVKESSQSKTATTLKIEGITDKPFGGWGDAKSLSAPNLDGTIISAKPAQAKGKASRFASMFNQPKDDPLSETMPQANGSNGSSEDAAGFQRIMAMLDKTTISPAVQPEGPTSPSARAVSNGARQRSRFTGFFDQTPKSPERVQTLPEGGMRPHEGAVNQSQRSFTDESGMFGSRLPSARAEEQVPRNAMASNPMSPEPMLPPPTQRSNDVFLDQPPSRGAATPDLNIQNLLASQRAQRAGGQDKNSAFLLDLLQTKGSSRPSSQQARPDSDFPLFFDQPPKGSETHAPQPRAPPPPGLFEDQLLRNNAPQDTSKQDMPQPMSGMDMPQRRVSQRAPPGFYDEQNLFMQQQQQSQPTQRRNFGEPLQQQLPPGRRMSGHPNLPPMQMPGMQQFPPGPPQLPDFMQSLPGGPPQGPPPGFNPHMARHPPGIHNVPNMFQGPQQHQPQGRDPPGFGGMPPNAMPPQGGMQSPPNAPPGFFGGPQGLPPGYMQMRSPQEPMPSGPPSMRGGRPFDSGFDNGGQRR